jgi:hypothetical protein
MAVRRQAVRRGGGQSRIRVRNPNLGRNSKPGWIPGRKRLGELLLRSSRAPLLESLQTCCFLFTLLGSGTHPWAQAGTLDLAAAGAPKNGEGGGNS